MINNRKKTPVKKLFIQISCLVISCLYFSISTASALTPEQRAIYNKGINFYDHTDTSCNKSNSISGASAGIDSDGSVYSSGLSGPYILEQWAIHTLKAVGLKKGGSESDYVTKEHVIALVAFALGEGGDIMNTSSIFNPLNTGLKAPELIQGAHAGDGTQSFKSFDAGVEAAARTIVGSNQSRLADVLSKPNSTAKDFMTALTYYQRYNGNKFWAAASLPPNQDSYYRERLSLISTVRNDYKNIASYIIGTQALEQREGKRDPSKLQFDAGPATSDSEPESVSSESLENCSCSPNNTSSQSTTVKNINDVIKKLGTENGGNTAISVSTIDGSIKGDYNGDKKMPTRSSYKIYTAYATLKAIEDNKITWTTTVSAKPGNPGPFSRGTVEEAMKKMIINSDNAAASALREEPKIGNPSQVSALLRSAGLSNNTVMGTGSSVNPAGTNSDSTANDFTKFLIMLHNKDLPGVSNEANYNKLIEYMKKATTDTSSAREGIAAGVSGVSVADKAGWAGGTVDPATNDVGIVYLQNKPYVISILTDAKNNFSGVKTIAEGVHKAISGETTGSDDENCEQGQSVGNAKAIVDMAIKLAWPESHGKEPKPEYTEAVKKHNSTRLGMLTDCGTFVSTVIRASGADKDFVPGGTSIMESYVRAHPEKWDVVDKVSSTSDLQPGDVLIVNAGGGQGANGHTLIYIGPQPPKNYDAASASYLTRTGNLGMVTIKDHRGDYLRARLK